MKLKEHWLFYSVCAPIGIYIYGIAAAAFTEAIHNFVTGADAPMVTFNPLKCYAAVFSRYGSGMRKYYDTDDKLYGAADAVVFVYNKTGER